MLGHKIKKEQERLVHLDIKYRQIYLLGQLLLGKKCFILNFEITCKALPLIAVGLRRSALYHLCLSVCFKVR